MRNTITHKGSDVRVCVRDQETNSTSRRKLIKKPQQSNVIESGILEMVSLIPSSVVVVVFATACEAKNWVRFPHRQSQMKFLQ